MMSKISIQSKTLFKIFFSIYIPIIVLLVLIVLVSLKTGIPVGTFTRDAAVTAGKAGLTPSIALQINPFLGLISNLGILLWCICASICFFVFFCSQLLKAIRSKAIALSF